MCIYMCVPVSVWYTWVGIHAQHEWKSKGNFLELVSPSTLLIQDIACEFCCTAYSRLDVLQVGDSPVSIPHLQKSAVVTNAYNHFLCRFLGLNSNCQACVGCTFIFLVILMIPSSPISKASMKTLYIPSHGVEIILSLIPTYIIVSYHHCTL